MITLPGVDPMMIANNIEPLEATHPGEFLREEIEERGITQTYLADRLGVKVSQLNEIINGKRSITLEFSMLLEAALGIEAEYWVNLQSRYDRGRISRDASFMERLAKIRRIAVL